MAACRRNPLQAQFYDDGNDAVPCGCTGSVERVIVIPDPTIARRGRLADLGDTQLDDACAGPSGRASIVRHRGGPLFVGPRCLSKQLRGQCSCCRWTRLQVQVATTVAAPEGPIL